MSRADAVECAREALAGEDETFIAAGERQARNREILAAAMDADPFADLKFVDWLVNAQARRLVADKWLAKKISGDMAMTMLVALDLVERTQ